MKKVNIFGDGLASVSPYITEQRRVNLYYDIRNDGDKNQIVVCCTPGLTRIVQLPNNPIRGMIQDGNYAYVVAGNQLFLISPNAGYTLLGSFGIPAITTPVSMAFNETQLCIVDGQTGYVVQINDLNILLASTPILVSDCQLIIDTYNNLVAAGYGT